MDILDVFDWGNEELVACVGKVSLQISIYTTNTCPMLLLVNLSSGKFYLVCNTCREAVHGCYEQHLPGQVHTCLENQFLKCKIIFTLLRVGVRQQFHTKLYLWQLLSFLVHGIFSLFCGPIPCLTIILYFLFEKSLHIVSWSDMTDFIFWLS